MCFYPRKIWRFFYLAIKFLTRGEAIDNIESPLREVFRQKSGLHTYRDHTLTSLLYASTHEHQRMVLAVSETTAHPALPFEDYYQVTRIGGNLSWYFNKSITGAIIQVNSPDTSLVVYNDSECH